MKKLSIPYLLWMGALVLIPTIVMIILSFLKTTGINFSEATFSLSSFQKLDNSIYLNAFLNSLKYSTLTTIVSLLIGYPAAYFLATSKLKYKALILVLLILPTWSNMLLRIIAWEKVFYPVSILNNIGISFDLIGTDIAIVIGMVSIYLPFMILPIYTVLERMDKSLIEASKDLGATPYRTFTKVTLPLSLNGIVTGIILIFLPSATAFALPERLGGGKVLLIGNIIEDLFKRVFNYNLGSLLSMILLLIMFSLMIILIKVDKKGTLGS